MSGEKKKQNESDVKVPVDLPEDSMTSYNPTHSHASFILSDEIPNLPNDKPDEINSMDTEAVVSGENLTDLSSGEDDQENRKPYVLRSMVGKGGFGEVWEAVQVRMNRIVAVKRPRVDVIEKKLHSHRETLDELRLQFRQEALTTANLAHPNIIPVHDLERDENGEPLMVMKYIRGRPWDKLILEDVDKLLVPDFLDKHLPILVQMAQATAFAHSRGVIHRDLKPSQIMVGEFGEVLLADWGLSVVYDPGKLSEIEQSANNDFLPTTQTASNPAGTPAFMAPEQTEQTAEEIGPWTDVYLLGGTLYYLLTLKVPHRGVNAAESFLKARFGDVVPPQEVVESREISEELADLAMQALTYDIEDRIQTVTDFLGRLKDIQTGAGRRRRSKQIVDEVTVSLDENEKTYSLMASCETRLNEAKGLWGDNPEVPFLRRIVHSEGCKFALKNGDLAMARTHAESLDAGPHRDEAMADVAAAEALSHQRERQRRLATWAVAIMTMAIITIMSIYFQKITYERKIALQAQERAFMARNDSQSLINFMLSDLAEYMPAQNQSKVLKKLVDRTVDYYDRLPDEDHSYETLVQESEALLISASLESNLANSDVALEKLAKQREVASTLYSRKPDLSESLSNVTLNYLFTSFVLRERGDKTQSELYILKALYVVADFLSRNADPQERGKWKDVATTLSQSTDIAELGEYGGQFLQVVEYMTAWKDSDVRWANDMSFFYSRLGEVFLEDGYYEYAREAFHRAARIRYELMRSKDHVGKGWFLSAARDYPSLMQSYISMGEVGMAEGNLDLAIQDLQTVIEMSDEAPDDLRSGLEVARLSNRARSLLSQAFYQSGKYTEALQCSVDAVKLISDQSRAEPASLLLRRDLAEAHRQAGRVYMALEDYDLARNSFQKAVPIALKLVASDPNNRVFALVLSDLLVDYMNLAKAYKENGDLKSAEAICNQCRDYVDDNDQGIPLQYSNERIKVRALIGQICN